MNKIYLYQLADILAGIIAYHGNKAIVLVNSANPMALTTIHVHIKIDHYFIIMAEYKHIVGCFNTGLYYSNAGYVLAQVMSLTFCKQMSGVYSIRTKA